MKKIVGLMLTFCILGSLSIPCYAKEFESDNISAEEKSDIKISRDEIEQIYEEQDKTMPAESATTTRVANKMSDKEILLENIYRIQELEQQKEVVNNNDVEEINEEIEDLYSEINSLESVVDLGTSQESNEVTTRGAKPDVPTSTKYLKSYGITTDTSYGGEDYQVYEVVVYTLDTNENNAGKNPLLYADEIDLLDDGEYTRSDFFQDVTCVSSYIVSLIDIPYALYSTIVPPRNYFGTSCSQSLTYEYSATQIFIYAYVAEKGVNWFDHMQTSERLAVTPKIIARANDYGDIWDKTKNIGKQVLKSDNYADVNEPTKRYHKGYTNYKSYKVGALKVYSENEDGDKEYKGKISTDYYSTVWSIPGL